MSFSRSIRHALSLSLLLSLSPSALAQWSGDAATNLPVAQGSGEQVQPKFAPTADGGCYLSWFDSNGGGALVHYRF